MRPLRGSQSPAGKGFAAAGFVRQLHAFALRGVDDGVIADHIAAANRMDADLVVRAFADDSLASVPRVRVVRKASRFGQNLRELFRGAARGILLQPVMHLDDFEIERWAEDFRRLFREPEKRVHADAVVRRKDHGDLRGGMIDRRELRIRVAGGPHDADFSVLHAAGEHEFQDVRAGEVDHRIAARHGSGEVAAHVHFAREFERRIAFRASDQSLAHAAFGAIDENAEWSRHVKE